MRGNYSTSKSVGRNLRNTGIHACGVIITPSDITDFVPVPPKIRLVCDAQFDNSVVETAENGFLGFENPYLIKTRLN
jgi:DNA polymerase-3 subunit alpha